MGNFNKEINKIYKDFEEDLLIGKPKLSLTGRSLIHKKLSELYAGLDYSLSLGNDVNLVVDYYKEISLLEERLEKAEFDARK